MATAAVAVSLVTLLPTLWMNWTKQKAAWMMKTVLLQLLLLATVATAAGNSSSSSAGMLQAVLPLRLYVRRSCRKVVCWVRWLLQPTLIALRS